jgi:DNA-directed RNA polymerase specialized sigma24 family protein
VSARDGHRFDEVNDHDDHWKLLVAITARKACKQRRRHYADKRGGGALRSESVFLRPDGGEEHHEGVGQVLGQEPTPELADMKAEDCRRMLNSLDDETLRHLTLFTLEGYDTQEIAEKLGCVRRSVERNPERIPEKWSWEKEPLS